MAIQLKDGSLFLHNPRCGGTFVTAVLRRLDLISGQVGLKHDCPGVVQMPMTVPHHVFIRHPYHWIKSVWSYQAANDWPKWPKPVDGRWWHPFADICNPPYESKTDFRAFLVWMNEKHPGFATDTFVKFAGWPTSVVYDTDEMQHELPKLLAALGVAPDEAQSAIVWAYSKQGPRNDFPLPKDPDMQTQVTWLHHETTAMERWHYV